MMVCMSSSLGQIASAITRRRVLQAATAAGVGSTLLPGALLALATSPAEAQSSAEGTGSWPAITPQMIDAAAAIAAVKLTDEQKKMLLDGVADNRQSALRVRELHLPNAVAPVTVSNPVPAGTPPPAPVPNGVRFAKAVVDVSAFAGRTLEKEGVASEILAFASVRQLGALLRARKVTSAGLTKMYLARLKRYDPTLHFVITLTEERALKQADTADRELHSGHDRGPLHGIPWGAKDLLAVAGYPTTWGAAGFESQAFSEDAEVVKRLDAAGAVLVAKLTLGALAQGDLWGSAAHGGRTRNPWRPEQGSSGSSAGSASAVSAGCVAFAIGSETLGSIASPCTRCGVTGLRPSYGLVPRTGAMALSWSMDKLGPIARSVEDCALVLAAIAGPDGRDLSCQPAGFAADFSAGIHTLRVGFLKSAFDEPKPMAMTEADYAKMSAAERARHEAEMRDSLARRIYDNRMDLAALDRLRRMGITLTPCELPQFPFGALHAVLSAEAAAAFDELTTSGRDSLLLGQKPFDWPNGFRTARFITAVDYIQAQRARTLAIKAMHDLFANFDVIVAPTFSAQLQATNLCGQPAVVVPNGLRGDDAPTIAITPDDPSPGYGGPGTPVSITFLAPLYGEGRAVSLAAAYQRVSGFADSHPRLPA
jgi:Asp-tRNA(Asn)/Glu-tRNA(Gln) amidotransferase A subunit family amidase